MGGAMGDTHGDDSIVKLSEGQTAECEKRTVPKVIGKNYYTNHLIRKLPFKLENIRPKKNAA
jgi:hypothetical protein